MARLNQAVRTVQDELDSHGIWTPKIESVDVYLTWASPVAYAYQLYKGTGDIEIPAIALLRLLEVFSSSPRTGLRDVLRHEYGHVLRR